MVCLLACAREGGWGYLAACIETDTRSCSDVLALCIGTTLNWAHLHGMRHMKVMFGYENSNNMRKLLVDVSSHVLHACLGFPIGQSSREQLGAEQLGAVGVRDDNHISTHEGDKQVAHK